MKEIKLLTIKFFKKMVKDKLNLSDLHFEHTLWNNELAFYKDELSVLEPRIYELSTKYTSKEVLEGIEHFQNQFLIQKQNIHDLQDDIDTHEKNLAGFAQDNPVGIDQLYFSNHAPFRQKMEKQRTIYHDLKKGFFLFLEKWM